jgi:hypothetical protein
MVGYRIKRLRISDKVRNVGKDGFADQARPMSGCTYSTMADWTGVKVTA